MRVANTCPETGIRTNARFYLAKVRNQERRIHTVSTGDDVERRGHGRKNGVVLSVFFRPESLRVDLRTRRVRVLV